MSAPIAREDALFRYIPQRPPVVMIDELWVNEQEKTVTGLTVREDNPFFENGMLREPALVENIAQTAAARVGHYYAEKTEGEQDPPLGFIAAVKGLKVHDLPVAGDGLRTTVTVQHEVMNVTIIRGEVMCGEKLLAECEMKIFLREEESS